MAEYKYKTTSRNGIRGREHRFLAEKALGKPLPVRAVVHHVNGDGTVNIGNLVICENQAYHFLLHRRQEALKKCGHANWRRCWLCQKFDSPDNLYIPKSKSPYHKGCWNKRRRLPGGYKSRKENQNTPKTKII